MACSMPLSVDQFFASRNAKHVRAGLQHVQSSKGSLIIVKNYTGDRLNFGLAAENTRAYDDLDVELVSIQDDVSVPRSRSGLVGRRGLAGIVLVHMPDPGACGVVAIAQGIVDAINVHQ
jgi:dihydroxyacetone kinase